MAVIINLKELFASDAQEIFTDKVNFNFNKLLELGIGEQGIQGIQGPIGSAGPPGIQGDPGERGNIWYTGVGDPNTLVFPDLIEGDFYLETNDSSIWQYQGSPASWIQITDLSEVVINILEAEGSPFIRGFGEFSPLDDRFITFAKRGNDNADIIADVSLGNTSNNDTLLLTNWNERVTSIDNFPASTDSEFNSIQHISVDHSINPLGRYHLEFGSLYESPSSPGVKELSSLNHNLKVRYLKDATVSVDYPVSNELINKARFSLTVPESGVIADISEQGIFEFITPKYNADSSLIKDDLTVRIGTTEPITETSYMDIAVDGLDISSNLKGINLGLVRELETFNEVTLTPALAGDWGMINISSNLEGLMVRGKTYHSDSVEVINTDGKLIDNGLGGVTIMGTSTTTGGYQGIFSDGKYLFAVSPGDSIQESRLARGYFQAWDISDPNNPLLLFNLLKDSSWSNVVGAGPSYDLHGNPSQDGPFPGYNTPNNAVFNYVPLTGVRDVAFAGKYGVYVRRAPLLGGAIGNSSFDSFFVFELDSDIPNDNSGLKIISWLGYDTTFSDFMIGSSYEGLGIPGLDLARRVKINGNYAYVMTTDDVYGGLVGSRLIAIDITNPTRPYVSSNYIETWTLNRFIDFDIHGEVAYILTNRLVNLVPIDYQRSIIKKSIYDPTALDSSISTTTNIETLNPLNLPDPVGSIKVVGNRVFVTADDNFWIYDDSEAPDRPVTLISNTGLPVNHTGYDLEVSGRYVYIYALNSTTDESTILTYDISDDTNPILIDGYEDFTGANRGVPSKMTIVGDKIFTVSARSSTVTRGGVSSVGINGINSPAARIGNIHSKDIKVSNNVSIAETLQVGRSATIGSGGLWVDKGVGINTDSSINVNISSLNEFNNLSPGVNIRMVGIEGLASQYNIPVVIGSAVAFAEIDLSSSITSNAIFGNVISMQDNTADTFRGLGLSFQGITSTNPVEGLNINGADTNYIEGKFDTPDVDKGSHTQIAAVKDEDTISSGVFSDFQMGPNILIGELHWIRIGNIVHLKGVVQLASPPTLSYQFNLPHDRVGGTYATNAMGAARTWQATGTFCNLSIIGFGSFPYSQAYFAPTTGTTISNAHGQLLYMDFAYEIV